ncbi:GTPase domain-containing protein [Georgenia faecalis]|uniref:GTPase domain-containing protein n=1 Tax=Georgenia faecalis TaxID=2483799 RepID=UPI0013DFE03D|nr:GTPase domain-containing protein [Georgenia faecalis]
MSVPLVPVRLPGREQTGVRSPLLDVVTDLEADVEAAHFPLGLPDVDHLRALQARVRTQISAHLLPRLRFAAAPAVVVVGGSTGAGKSTLVNSTVGGEVSPAGVLRPTTRTPVLAVRAADAPLFAGHPLTELARLVETDGVPAGLALLDAPDFDSVHDDNRALADLLIETADLWVFVTTAARYGDAVPWRVLLQAQARGVSVAIVLNRVPARVLREVRADLLRRLDALGLGGAPLFVVDDVGPHEGLLPDGVVGPLRDWLALLGGRNTARGVVRRTTQGAWGSLREDLLRLADGVSAQASAAAALRKACVRAAAGPAEAVAARIAGGLAAQGAPTTRWLSLASTGGPLAGLLGDVSRLRRGWRSGGLRARSAAAAAVAADVRAALLALLTDAALEAHAAVRRAWVDGGASALEVPGDADAARRARVEAALDAWTRGTATALAPVAAPHGAALDEDGVLALVQAAAAGSSGAARAVRALLGTPGEAAVEASAEALLEEATAVIEAERDPFLTRLDSLDLQAAAGPAMRLRASELKGHR